MELFLNYKIKMGNCSGKIAAIEAVEIIGEKNTYYPKHPNEDQEGNYLWLSASISHYQFIKLQENGFVIAYNPNSGNEVLSSERVWLRKPRDIK